MSTKANEVKLDIEEWDKLLKQATREKVKNVISDEIQKLRTDLKKLVDAENACVKSSDATVNTAKKCYEVKINHYGWDQTNTSVMLYVFLENVQKLPKESVVCNFTDKSLDLHVLGLDNKNYVLTISCLCEEIDPTKSSWNIKKDTVVISLLKKEMKTWAQVTGTEKKTKASKFPIPDMDDEGEPGTRILNLMKTMYNEGDDDMKRTIAKAWTESMMKTGGPGLPNL
ncbi:calcyclin-binding protein [Augochlora pura]